MHSKKVIMNCKRKASPIDSVPPEKRRKLDAKSFFPWNQLPDILWYEIFQCFEWYELFGIIRISKAFQQRANHENARARHIMLPFSPSAQKSLSAARQRTIITILYRKMSQNDRFFNQLICNRQQSIHVKGAEYFCETLLSTLPVSLKRLVLIDVIVNRKSLEAIRRLQLEVFQGTGFVGFFPLHFFTNMRSTLRELVVTACFTLDEVRKIVSFQKLTHLSLEHSTCVFTCSDGSLAMKYICQLPELRSLDFRCVNFNFEKATPYIAKLNESFVSFKIRPHLLTVHDAKECRTVFHRFKSLKSLSLTACYIQSFVDLSALTQLVELEVDAIFFARFTKSTPLPMPQLQSLTVHLLDDLYFINDLLLLCPNLEQLKLESSGSSQSYWHGTVAPFNKLRKLYIGWYQLSTFMAISGFFKWIEDQPELESVTFRCAYDGYKSYLKKYCSMQIQQLCHFEISD